MKVKLYLLIGWLTASAAFAQGTFTYTFSGDNSPLNVWATFQVGGRAVASGSLTTSDIISGYVLQGGNRWEIFSLSCPVDPVTALPSGNDADTKLVAFHNLDEIDICGGQWNSPYTEIVYWPWIGSPSLYPRSSGKWNVTQVVPEPCSFFIFMVGLGLLVPCRWWCSGRPNKDRPEPKDCLGTVRICLPTS
jgi:hypothetical protein